MPGHALDGFHPLVRRWFAGRFAAPTDAQVRAWPLIASGKHVLVSAPTGSGKTLTAFLAALDNLICGRWSCGAVRVLYLSPLKALGSDIRLNLLEPLRELSSLFAQEGCPFPPIRVMTRSGDTPDDERRSMLRHPPEILITTPESLNLMLTGSRSRNLFAGVKSVILDEIHALAASKRGTYMISAVERLTLVAGEFQRIALSATVRPAESIARWMAGYEGKDLASQPHYTARPVEVVRAADKRGIVLSLHSPDVDLAPGPEASDLWWEALARELRVILAKNRATLLFANSRRSVEKLVRLLNTGESEPVAYSHHGSLARELRLDVEERMKQGRLRAVVATGSLELGIDIGSVDEVILIGTPPSVAQSLQRIGRAEHRVGGTSRAHLFILHDLDGAKAASLARTLGPEDVEEIHPLRNVLDVLAQVLLSMGCQSVWDLDHLFAFVRTMTPFHELPRLHFDLVVAMLAGRYADAPVRELKARALVDRVNNTFTARPGTEFVLYQSGGTIPDRGYYHLRIADSKAVIGELDEEFVWERKLGDQFSLGTQAWRILKVTHNDVEVGPADAHAPLLPFWKAEDQNRSTQASFALLDFFDVCEAKLEGPDFAQELAARCSMDAASAHNLVRFLRRQREVAQAPLPGRQRILVECNKDPSSPSDTQQIVLHTFWGGKVNRPLALAMAEAWERRFGEVLQTFATNDHILFFLPTSIEPALLFDLVQAAPLHELLRACLEKSALFGARFRENASRALLLPRGDARKRYPLWLNRLRAKKLLASVLRYPDFPILVETWRDLLEDEFDLSTLASLLDDVASKRIVLHETRPAHATPFCEGLAYRQTNYHMYLDDTPGSANRSNLSDELFRNLVHGENTLPTVPVDLAADFTRKLLRTYPGYEPTTREEVLLAVREIPLLPQIVLEEWLARLPPDESSSPSKEPLALLVVYRLPGASQTLVADLADLPRILALRGADVASLPALVGRFSQDREEFVTYVRTHPFRSTEASAATLVADYLRSRAGVSLSELGLALGWDEASLLPLLDELSQTESIVRGPLVDGNATLLYCDAENAERLFRLQRAARRNAAEVALPARPLSELPLFLAHWQGLGQREGSLATLQTSLDRLFGFPLAAELWEEAILPSRLAPYDPSWLDTLFQSYGLSWFGCGKERLSFAFAADLDLFREGSAHHASEDALAARLEERLGETDRGVGFFELASNLPGDSSALAQALWKLAWQGRATSDSFESVRRGALHGFGAEEGKATSHGDRASLRRWQRARPGVGAWHAFPEQKQHAALESAELDKERTRVLLARYGVVFRELVEHELAPLRWAKVFRALRLLELGGEIVSGHFFTGIPGIQFATPEAIRTLASALPEETLHFVHACDPASLCGVGLAGLAEAVPHLPRRMAGNWMVLRGSRIVLVLQKNGRELFTPLAPDDPELPAALAIYRFLLGRAFAPPSSLTIEKINGERASSTAYAQGLRQVGFTNDYRGVSLWKR